MFNWLTGYKTIIGCIGAVAAFIVLVCAQLADGFQMADVQPILVGFSAMMVAVGLGAKVTNIQKAIDTLKK